GVVAACEVALDEGTFARHRVAVAAAARRRHGDPVALADEDALILGKMRRHVVRAVDADDDLVGAAVAAAEHALRPDAPVIHDEGGARLAAAEPHRVADAEAAAPAAGAARALGER